MSIRAISSGRCSNGLPSPVALIISRVSSSNCSSNFSLSSSCHCSVSEPGATIRQRSSSPRINSSLISRPAMIVLPAPGSSASRKRIGWRGSMCSYTALIWWGSGSIALLLTAT